MFFINVVDPFAKALGEWSVNINLGSILFRLFLALVLSFLIGFERSSRNHAAGLRTYILVTLGATTAMFTNQFIFESYGAGDGARLGAQVISGIGFLGAGTIMVTSKSQIRGLTTAAGLWACACTGLAIGSGFYTLAICATIAILGCFTILQVIENHLKDRSRNFTIHVELYDHSNFKDLINYIRSLDITVQRVESNPAYDSTGLAVYTMYLSNDKRYNFKDMLHIPFISAIRDLPYLNYIEEIS